jgi:adenylate cyclase class 2
MSIEIEAKLSVPSLEPTRARLEHLGAERVGLVVEMNTFFDTDDRSLLAADKGLRLRQARDAAAASKAEAKSTLTYKGPRRHGQLKNREEIELGINGDRALIDLLGALGFGRVLTFEKRRESWKLNGCSVELDELPHLGTFVEIEGPDEPSILEVRKQLQLDQRPLVKASYVALLMTHLQERGQTTRVVTFESSTK